MRAILILLLTAVLYGCESESGLNEQVEAWSLKISPRAGRREVVEKIGPHIYDNIYKGNVIMYSEFGSWDYLHVYGLAPARKSEIEKSLNAVLSVDKEVQWGTGSFPEAFLRRVESIKALAPTKGTCSSSWIYRGPDPFEVSGRLTEIAAEIGLPVTAVVYEGGGERTVMTIDLYTDCEAAENIVDYLKGRIKG